MEEQKREFVGGIENVTPENIYAREQAQLRANAIFGLNPDYSRQIQSAYKCLLAYPNASEEERTQIILTAPDEFSRMPPYEEHSKTNLARQSVGLHEATLTEDVAPYAQAVSELVEEMRGIAFEIKSAIRRDGITDEINRPVALLGECVAMVNNIIQSQTSREAEEYSADNNLHTDPAMVAFDHKNLSRQESLRLIKERLKFAKELLKTGPLPGSFSFLRDDGNVTPVDWEPTDEERKKLAEKPKKIRP